MHRLLDARAAGGAGCGSGNAGLSVHRMLLKAGSRVRRQDDGAGAAHGGPVVSEGGAADEADLVVLPVGAAVGPGKTVRAKILNEPPEQSRRHAGRTPCNPKIAIRRSRIGRLAALARIENRAKRPSGTGFTVTRESKNRRTPWFTSKCANGQSSV